MESGQHGEVFVERDDAVALVEIRREPRNLVDFMLIRNIVEVYDELGRDSSCGAIVLASDGEAFSAGGNHSWDREVQLKYMQSFYDVCLRLFRSPVPVVAAIQGYTAGGGLGLAMSADFRIASENATFQASFVVKGLSPGFGLTRSLAYAIGEQRASVMLQTGCEVDAARALAHGLVDVTCSAGVLRTTAVEFARGLVANAPLAREATRRLLRDKFAEEVAEHMAREAIEQVPLFNSNDWREGYQAYAEARPPRFSRT